jgi:hypothetical protein
VDAGTQVRWVASGDLAVVIRTDGDRCQVLFPDGQQRWLPIDELDQVATASSAIDPQEILAEGRLGEATSYALRLQAIYPRHAYKYDPRPGTAA